MKLLARLSKPNQTIAQLLKPGHGLSGPINNWGNIRGATLYYGTAYAGEPDWVDFVRSGTPTNIPTLNNRGGVGLLFVPIQRRYMIYSFGITITKLSAQGFERDFGLKVVLNTVHPRKLRSIDSKIIDTVVINKRTQLSKENAIEDFGFEVNKDLLKGVTGKPDDTGFASLVSGSDTLGINCDVTATTLRRKTTAILAAYNITRYRRHYRWFDNIKPVKDSTTIATLDAQLLVEFNAVLGGANNTIFQLASPTIIDFHRVDHFKFRGYRSQETFPLPSFENLIADLVNRGVTNVTRANLESYHVDGVEADGPEMPGAPLYDWLIAELRIGADSFILSEGEWFKISRSYFNTVDVAFRRILGSRSEYARIGTTTHPNESLYLQNYTVTANEMILDKGLSYVYGRNNSIEICDIYNRNREFIHVKDSGGSSKLSHLFNQGYVSAMTFLSEPAYVTDIRNKLRLKPVLRQTISTPVSSQHFTIVFRILKNGPTFTLPFFTKVVIEEMYRKIKILGFKFRLEWVEKI